MSITSYCPQSVQLALYSSVGLGCEGLKGKFMMFCLIAWFLCCSMLSQYNLYLTENYFSQWINMVIIDHKMKSSAHIILMTAGLRAAWVNSPNISILDDTSTLFSLSVHFFTVPAWRWNNWTMQVWCGDKRLSEDEWAGVWSGRVMKGETCWVTTLHSKVSQKRERRGAKL